MTSHNQQQANELWVSGRAAVFGEPDLSGDVIAKGAFRNVSQGRFIPTRSARVKMLYQHTADKPIGRWERLEERDDGLYATGVLFTDTRLGTDLSSLLQGGAIDGLSIGFKPRRSRPLRGGGRLLLDVDLWEISIVTFPMAPGARLARIGGRPMRPARNLLTTPQEKLIHDS